VKVSAIEVGNLTDIGKKRKHNEDYYGFFRLGEDEFLAIVADGMGGHASGEIASRMAVEIIQEVYSKERAEQEVLDSLKSAFEVANFSILQKSLEQDQLNGMGTTATVLVIKEDQTFVGHMGDSRAYLFRDGAVNQLTKDHSMVNRMVEQGLLSKEEAEHHPQRNVIYKALGVNRDADLELIGPLPVYLNDIFLLCSDGLTNLVTDDEMLKIVKKESPQKACEKLIQLANKRGGDDNITIQILKMVKEQKR
jgi:serine/threonine protein phosphatase PrpC